MGLDIQKDKVPLNKVTHSVRASQAVLQYGVGAMVDFPDQTLMTAAPEYWRERVEQIHDERLEKLLHVDFFGAPGSKEEARYAEGISYVRFPEWYFCPKCRRFMPISQWLDEYKRKGRAKDREIDPYMVKHMKCPTCFQELVVARVVTVCENGHIDDFPWVKWTHCRSFGGAKPICASPRLKFKTGASSTEGLEGLEVSCEACGAKTTLKGAFAPDVFQQMDKEYPGVYDFSCTGHHPWKHKHEICGLYPRALQRGSSSVYFPVTASSLVIPPYSNLLTTKIEGSAAFAECKSTIANMLKTMPGMKDAIMAMMIPDFAQRIAAEISNLDPTQIEEILIRKWGPSDAQEYSTTSVRYRAEEYDALRGTISISSGDYGDFMRESTNISDYNLPFIKGISLIHKIREVQALIGFARIKPAEKSETTNEPDRVVPIKESSTNWYPAYQVRGEGIFIEFDQDAINEWRTKNPEIRRRAELLNAKYAESYIGVNSPRKISEKFLLLHTISHLLIKQLSFECGYSIASIKERLYCSEEADGKAMAGILIYTASGDSEGTMGGLVRQGRADTFPSMFKKSIQSAMTCSNDPVCSLSTGQGRDSLNMAACYSCTLIPETSCEEFNIFLDRGAVVGTFSNPGMGFFSAQLYGESGWATARQTGSPLTSHGPLIRPILLFNNGTDMRDVPYAEIWSQLIQWSDNVDEKSLLKALAENAEHLVGKEKPISDCDITLTGEAGKCDLLWPKSKVAFFTDDNAEGYHLAVESEWSCFLGSDKSLTWQKIFSEIGEK